MSVLIDTNIAIHLRDGGREVGTRMAGLPAPPAISIISLVELRGSTLSGSAGDRRRERLDIMLSNVAIIGFDEAVVFIYADIIRHAGFARRRILDRLIAATAIVHDLTLVTTNGTDFRDIPDLKLEVWPSPAQ